MISRLHCHFHGAFQTSTDSPAVNESENDETEYDEYEDDEEGSEYEDDEDEGSYSS